MADPVPSVSIGMGLDVVTASAPVFTVAENDLFCARGQAIPIASRQSPTQITLKQPWPVASLAGEPAFSILSLGEYWRSAITINKRFADLLTKWEVITPFKFDAAGTLAQRDGYNDQRQGFVYISFDPLPVRVFVKLANTNSPSDWSAPIYIGSGGQVEYQEALDQERQRRIQADAALGGRIDSEVTTRTAQTAGLNARLDIVETRAAQPLGATDSPTFANTSLDGPSSAIKYATFKTGGKLRFAWLLNNASETGSNAGSNFELATFADDGSYLATPVRVSRANGDLSVNSLSVNGRTRLQTMEPGSYTIGTLPAGIAGAVIYVADAVKRGEASGSATGCLAQYSKGFWRRISDDSRVEFPPTLTRGQLIRAISTQLNGGVGAFQQDMISPDRDNINNIAFFHEDLAPYDGFLANQVRAYCQTKLGMSSADAETKIGAMYAYAATLESGK